MYIIVKKSYELYYLNYQEAKDDWEERKNSKIRGN